MSKETTNKRIEIKGLYPKQRDIINAVLQSNATFHIINASRQSGKTYGVSYLLMALSLISSNSNESAIVVAPTYGQSKIMYNNIIKKDSYRRFIRSKKSSAPFQVVSTSNFTIDFKSADQDENLRGGSYKYIIADEFAFWKKDEEGNSILMDVLFPMTTAKQNVKIIILSTPNGVYNEFYDLVGMCNTDKDNYKYYTLHYSDKPAHLLNKEAIEVARSKSPKMKFDQEYNLVFINSGGEVFENVLDVSTLEEYSSYDKANRYYAGLDFGSVGDNSVLTILDKDRKVVSLTIYSGDYVEQINGMVRVLKEYNPILYAESNSMGLANISFMRKEYSNIKEFITSNTSKKNIIESLKMIIYKKEIILPSVKLCGILNKELNNYTFSQTKTGLITYHHRSGEHDDTVMSLAIANFSYEQHNKSFSNVKMKRSSNFYNQ
jgi:phage FluMu gp28-like protein